MEGRFSKLPPEISSLVQLSETVLTISDVLEGLSKEVLDSYSNCKNDIDVIVEGLKEIQDLRNQQSVAFQESKEILDDIDKLRGRISYIKDNIPSCFKSVLEKPKKGAHSIVNNEHQNTKKKIRQISYVTVEQFNSIPQYMRSRMKYEEINNYVDIINKAFTSKYNIVFKNQNLKYNEKKAKFNYSIQAVEELKGMHFITEDDLKMVPGMNMKLFVKKIIPMLRHCAVLKELHKSGISYYVIPS